jgi:LysR family hydrogen peroxide-inducible transcriptional activator
MIDSTYHMGVTELQELRYVVALAEFRHFGHAAEACHVSQPTLSGQLRKLEERLGVRLFERNNKRVALTAVGEKVLAHARQALEAARMVEEVARAYRDPLAAPLKLGIIPTLAPYLMPLILGPLRDAYPQMTIELWEDLTHHLLAMLRTQRLDAALIATEVDEKDLTAIPLFVEPFVAALPRAHPLARAASVSETDLAPDLLVLADGHCLAMQSWAACGRQKQDQSSFQAASLDTLVNLVAAGYGTTLIPELAVPVLGRGEVVLRPLMGGASRTIRLASRPSFPRPQALKAVERVVKKVIADRKPAAWSFAS